LLLLRLSLPLPFLFLAATKKVEFSSFFFYLPLDSGLADFFNFYFIEIGYSFQTFWPLKKPKQKVPAIRDGGYGRMN
jgi:hypothetical protein